MYDFVQDFYNTESTMANRVIHECTELLIGQVEETVTGCDR